MTLKEIRIPIGECYGVTIYAVFYYYVKTERWFKFT